MTTAILGISAYYHDSAAALVVDGCIVAAAQEERFSRKKQDPGFPSHAIRFCLEHAHLDIHDVDFIVFYDKPLIKFERLLETYLAYAPSGLRSFLTSMPIWLKEKLFLKQTLRKELSRISDTKESELPPLLFTEHHQAHAASAFFPSPFTQAAVLCLDGVGEWATTSLWHGDGKQLTPLWQLDFPHSLGLLYSAFTYYMGFKVNSGEYKVMGLAPYGEPRFVSTIYEHLVDLKPDGTFRLNMAYFNYATGLTMTNRRFDRLFGGPPRRPEGPLTAREMDLARSVQAVCEEIVLRLSRTALCETACKDLCLAGGVALNCVANGRILRETEVQRLWIQPAAGDAGGALGAALAAWHGHLGQARKVTTTDAMSGSYLGPGFSNEDIAVAMTHLGGRSTQLADDELFFQVADHIAQGKVVGWFSGRMEFGPRALGARSILGDARNPEMQSTMNLKIKYRESFRPFAPSVLKEFTSNYFDLSVDSPYMLLVAQVKKDLQQAMSADESELFGIDKLHLCRSTIPAVTHVDYSARIQTVDSATNPRYHALLMAFKERSSCGVLVNTSFNVRGEPIVCTPEDAYRCFMRTEMDYLVLENHLLNKTEQAPYLEKDDWKNEFELD